MRYAGRELTYTYRRFLTLCSETELQACSNDISQQYAKLTKHWTIDLNSEWSCRMYFATKMILNATVLLNSLEFAKEVGLRTANSYFEYYATLSLLRGLACTLPGETWKNGKLLEISHSKAINVGVDWIAKFNRNKARELKETVSHLKAKRELIAYRAPASGDSNLGDDYDLADILMLLAEVAQFNSELLQASVEKNADPTSFVVLDEHISSIRRISIEGYTFFDHEDGYRLSYVQRKIKRPYQLAWFMTEGQTEDFIGAWDGDEDRGELFSNGSPSNWQAIFDIP